VTPKSDSIRRLRLQKISAFSWALGLVLFSNQSFALREVSTPAAEWMPLLRQVASLGEDRGSIPRAETLALLELMEARTARLEVTGETERHHLLTEVHGWILNRRDPELLGLAARTIGWLILDNRDLRKEHVGKINDLRSLLRAPGLQDFIAPRVRKALVGMRQEVPGDLTEGKTNFYRWRDRLMSFARQDFGSSDKESRLLTLQRQLAGITDFSLPDSASRIQGARDLLPLVNGEDPDLILLVAATWGTLLYSPRLAGDLPPPEVLVRLNQLERQAEKFPLASGAIRLAQQRILVRPLPKKEFAKAAAAVHVTTADHFLRRVDELFVRSLPAFAQDEQRAALMTELRNLESHLTRLTGDPATREGISRRLVLFLQGEKDVAYFATLGLGLLHQRNNDLEPPAPERVVQGVRALYEEAGFNLVVMQALSRMRAPTVTGGADGVLLPTQFEAHLWIKELDSVAQEMRTAQPMSKETLRRIQRLQSYSGYLHALSVSGPTARAKAMRDLGESLSDAHPVVRDLAARGLALLVDPDKAEDPRLEMVALEPTLRHLTSDAVAGESAHLALLRHGFISSEKMSRRSLAGSLSARDYVVFFYQLKDHSPLLFEDGVGQGLIQELSLMTTNVHELTLGEGEDRWRMSEGLAAFLFDPDVNVVRAALLGLGLLLDLNARGRDFPVAPGMVAQILNQPHLGLVPEMEAALKRMGFHAETGPVPFPNFVDRSLLSVGPSWVAELKRLADISGDPYSLSEERLARIGDFALRETTVRVLSGMGSPIERLDYIIDIGVPPPSGDGLPQKPSLLEHPDGYVRRFALVLLGLLAQQSDEDPLVPVPEAIVDTVRSLSTDPHLGFLADQTLSRMEQPKVKSTDYAQVLAAELRPEGGLKVSLGKIWGQLERLYKVGHRSEERREILKSLLFVRTRVEEITGDAEQRQDILMQMRPWLKASDLRLRIETFWILGLLLRDGLRDGIDLPEDLIAQIRTVAEEKPPSVSATHRTLTHRKRARLEQVRAVRDSIGLNVTRLRALETSAKRGGSSEFERVLEEIESAYARMDATAKIVFQDLIELPDQLSELQHAARSSLRWMGAAIQRRGAPRLLPTFFAGLEPMAQIFEALDRGTAEEKMAASVQLGQWKLSAESLIGVESAASVLARLLAEQVDQGGSLVSIAPPVQNDQVRLNVLHALNRANKKPQVPDLVASSDELQASVAMLLLSENEKLVTEAVQLLRRNFRRSGKQSHDFPLFERVFEQALGGKEPERMLHGLARVLGLGASVVQRELLWLSQSDAIRTSLAALLACASEDPSERVEGVREGARRILSLPWVQRAESKNFRSALSKVVRTKILGAGGKPKIELRKFALSILSQPHWTDLASRKVLIEFLSSDEVWLRNESALTLSQQPLQGREHFDAVLKIAQDAVETGQKDLSLRLLGTLARSTLGIRQLQNHERFGEFFERVVQTHPPSEDRFGTDMRVIAGAALSDLRGTRRLLSVDRYIEDVWKRRVWLANQIIAIHHVEAACLGHHGRKIPNPRNGTAG
jgi:hypothetical protein